MSQLRTTTLKGMMWSTVEKFSTQGVSFLFTIVLARLLSPSDYGIIAMMSIFFAICQTFIDSGFANALIRKIDRTEKDKVTTFYFNIIVGIICYGIIFILAPYIAQFYNIPLLKPLARILGLNLILQSFCIIQQVELTCKINFKMQAKISLIAVIASGTIGLCLAYKGLGVWSLVVQSLTQTTIRTILLWILVRWSPKEKFSKESFHYLFSYGSRLLMSNLLDTIYNNIYPLVIGKFYTPAQLGTYSRALHFGQFPSSTFTGILQRVSFPVLSSIQNETERLKNNYVKFLKLSTFLIFPMMLLLAALAKPLVLFLLTDKWHGVIPLLQILCFSLMWYPVHAINLNLLQVKGRSDLFLRLEIIKKCVGVAILIITLPRGVTAMCYGMVVSSYLSLMINTYYTGKLISIGFFKQMQFLLPIFLNSLIMGLISWGLTHLIQSYLLQLIICGTLGVVYYVSSNILIKSPELKEILSIMRKK